METKHVTDRKTRDRLKREALRACKWRGHSMGEWEIPDFWTRCRYSACTICGKSVYIDPSPAPNGIDISGEAVALNCNPNSIIPTEEGEKCLRI